MKFGDLLESGETVVFDGSMGTRLQALGLPPGGCPEELNASRPDLIRTVHREYADAGAQVVETNTFGANRRKLAEYGLQNRVAELISRAVEIARSAAGDRAAVGLSLGPTGLFLEPVGPLGFEEALETFGEAIEAARAAGADLVVIETMSDLLEVRAAAMASREAGLPFVITMTFEQDGRTLLGTPPAAGAAVAAAMGASMFGANCSLGPKELLPVAQDLVAASTLPVLIQPNAGIPRLEGSRTVFPVGPDEFAAEAEGFFRLGVRGFGGCCGTTPEHIAALDRALGGRRPPALQVPRRTVLASRARAVDCGGVYPLRIVGERVNPTGKKALSAELVAGETGRVREEALGQAAAGADLLDVNVGVPGLDEKELLPRVVRIIQNLVDCPLVLDSADPEALEAALLVTAGKPLLNSVSGKAESLERVLPLAARYGAAVLCLPLDKEGVPRTADDRLEIAGRIVRAAEAQGLRREDLVVDGLTMAVGADERQPQEILEAIRRIRDELGLTTVLGVSNVSFGLPSRAVMNSSFLSMAAAAGLDMAILNPYDAIMTGSARAADALRGRDPGARRYLSFFSAAGAAPLPGGGEKRPLSPGERVRESVIAGDRRAAVSQTHAALEGGTDPIELGNRFIIPALEDVGDRFGRREFFLPQVIGAAEAARGAFDVIKRKFPQQQGKWRGTVVIATVEGDIHDIGKNIVVTLLENHGYRIVDLGTNVSPAAVVAAVNEHRPSLIGLSALMTTTLPSMEATIRALRETGTDVPVIVGGAVVTEEYARKIGAAAYAADALEAVRIAARLVGEEK